MSISPFEKLRSISTDICPADKRIKTPRILKEAPSSWSKVTDVFKNIEESIIVATGLRLIIKEAFKEEVYFKPENSKRLKLNNPPIPTIVTPLICDLIRRSDGKDPG